MEKCKLVKNSKESVWAENIWDRGSLEKNFVTFFQFLTEGTKTNQRQEIGSAQFVKIRVATLVVFNVGKSKPKCRELLIPSEFEYDSISSSKFGRWFFIFFK